MLIKCLGGLVSGVQKNQRGGPRKAPGGPGCTRAFRAAGLAFPDARLTAAVHETLGELSRAGKS